MGHSAKTILVAIDPSPASTSAFLEALRLSVSMKAKLIAVSVTPRYEGNMNRWKIEGADEQLEKPFKACLEEAATEASSFGQSVRTEHRIGEPVDEIIALAEEEGAGLLVIGYSDRSYVERVLLGRTAAKVIGLSPCDVLMIPQFGEVGFARILVGIDGSGYSMEAGQRALDLALSYGGEVHGITVLDVPVEKSLRYGVLDEARHKHFTALQILAGQGEKLGVPVVTELREGSAYEQIVQYSEEKDIQLIVLGSYGRTALTRLLMGSVVERVAALSRRPTLVVKKLSTNGVRDQV
ncbi:MAG: hypothetical protein A2X81_04685 [Desulfobacterales bacterium GWB2_56_26]|nr:MAG: hypothetical protein A2X81_04685 [Desulfobacterales bacterium GWB2_56_26]